MFAIGRFVEQKLLSSAANLGVIKFEKKSIDVTLGHTNNHFDVE
jgi:hypothetical protein